MKSFPSIVLLLTTLPLAAQEKAPDQRAMLKQAFDGAMTCSALTAIKADQALGDAQRTWANRSFAFGMLAVRFYTDLTQKSLSNADMNDALNEYAHSIAAMTPEELEPFESGCAGKYPDMDKLCEENDCVYPTDKAGEQAPEQSPHVPPTSAEPHPQE